MQIPCLRCGKILNSPSKKNARYIINQADVRTHGPREISSFEVHKGGNKLAEFDKPDKAHDNAEARRNSHRAEAVDKRNNITALEKALNNIPDIAGNSDARNKKVADIMTANNDLRAKYDELNSIEVKTLSKVKVVPKTGIICKNSNCQDPNDQIIWG